jgi:hypothetical protein
MDVQPFDAVVATLQFDESRMFDLLRMVRAHRVHRAKPFVAVRLTSGALPNEVVKTVMRSAIICGADAAVDYACIEAGHGAHVANLALRTALYSAALPSGAKSPLVPRLQAGTPDK